MLKLVPYKPQQYFTDSLQLLKFDYVAEWPKAAKNLSCSINLHCHSSVAKGSETACGSKVPPGKRIDSELVEHVL